MFSFLLFSFLLFLICYCVILCSGLFFYYCVFSFLLFFTFFFFFFFTTSHLLLCDTLLWTEKSLCLFICLAFLQPIPVPSSPMCFVGSLKCLLWLGCCTCWAAQSCLTCSPTDCSMPDFPVSHHLLELAQTHVHWVSEAIQPPHPLSSPSPPTFNISLHQSLIQWVSSLHETTKVLELQL